MENKMTGLFRIFSAHNQSHGTVLIELLLTIALAGTLMPFIYGYQNRAVVRAENVRVVRCNKYNLFLKNILLKTKMQC